MSVFALQNQRPQNMDFKAEIIDSVSARVAELEDALDLGSSGAIRRGSSPLSRTIKHQQFF